MVAPSLKVPNLTTQRLRLTPLAMNHSGGMYLMWRNKEVQKYSGPGKDVNGQPIRLPAQSSADSDKLIQFWLQAANDGWGFRWAILLSNESDIFIGHLGFNQLGEHAEIAYHMNPDYWGHGYMQEAAAEAIGWVKSRGTKQIEAFVDPKNHKSVRLTENLGLRSTSTYAEGAQKFERAF